MFQSIVEATGTSLYAIIAMVLFLIAFAVIVIAVLTRRQSVIDAQSRMPLDDDPTNPTITPHEDKTR